MSPFRIVPHSVVLAVSLLAVLSALAAAEPTRDVIDLSIRYQFMDNFSANDAWSMQKIGAWSEVNKNRVADLLFSRDKGIGLSCWRFNIGGGINRASIHHDWRTAETFETGEGSYDWTRQKNERWFLAAAKARGVTQFAATVYSPPGRLTRNGLTNAFGDAESTTNLKAGAEDAFARYMTDILVHFRDNPDKSERIGFDSIFPVNEPQWDWSGDAQEGNRASNGDIKRIYTALALRMRKAGLKTIIRGPESGNIPDMYSQDSAATAKWKAEYGNYIRTFCSDPAMADCMGRTITYHSYWSDQIPDQLVPHRQQLRKAMDQYAGWKIWQSEYCIMEWKRDLTMNAALRVARVIHSDLAIVGASAWHWWSALDREDYKSALIFTDYKNPGDPEAIYESKILWVLGNYSRYIRPGMRRVELRRPASDINGLLGSAYLEPRSGALVVVYVNSGQQPASLSLEIRGDSVRGRRFFASVTSESMSLAPQPEPILPALVRIPAQCVVTLVSVPPGYRD